MVELLLLSRLQFAITVAFHFLFVPLTLGLALLVAGMETMYYRNKDETWRKMAGFWGRIFKINFAIGLVTGLAMTFQFGTNWGAYAEFMGDVFGPPLAVEALLAFFLVFTLNSYALKKVKALKKGLKEGKKKYSSLFQVDYFQPI